MVGMYNKINDANYGLAELLAHFFVSFSLLEDGEWVHLKLLHPYYIRYNLVHVIVMATFRKNDHFFQWLGDHYGLSHIP